MSNDQELKPYKGMKGRGAKKALPMETGDLTAIMQLAIKSSRMRMGHQAIFPADEKGLNEFVNKSIEFFQYVDEINADPDLEKKLIPDIEAWAMYLGITRQRIFAYEKRGGEWAETIAFFKNAISAMKKQLALNYKIPPMFAIFDLTNNHGYVNTSEFKLSTAENAVRPERSQQLETEIAAAGLVWDATSGEYIDKGAV